MPRSAVAPFSAAQLESLCKSLADTEGGLTGAEIARLLAQIGVQDLDPLATKWKRLLSALTNRQRSDNSGDRVLAFVSAALSPARYQGRADVFERRRQEANVILSFVGLEFGSDGRFHKIVRSATLSQAEERANRLRAALSARGVHPAVEAYCRTELVQNNCFHAVLEATKGVAERLRTLSGLQSDGAALVDEALGGTNPLLRINPYSTDSERSEHKGFVNLLKGMFGTFRNPTAHTPRSAWPLAEADALDLFSLCSYVHRRLDAASRQQPPSGA